MSKIVLFIANLEVGGAERVVSVLANNWAKDNDVYIVTLFNHPVQYEISDRVQIITLVDWIRGNLSSLQKIRKIISAMFKFRRLISSLEPDFVLSFMNKYNVFVLLSLFGMKVRVFVSERGSPFESISKIVALGRRLLYRYSSGLICQTACAKNIFSSTILLKDSVIIPNPVTYLPHDKNLESQNIILMVGRLVEGKGHRDLIEIAKGFKGQAWKFVFVGDGPLSCELVAKCHEYALDNVVFAGKSDRVGDWLKQAKIFIFSSYSEGFPNALAEALVFGLPCVSYDCPTGPSDLIADGENGFLVPCGDIKLFSEKLDQLMNNDLLRMRFATNAIKLRSQFSEEKISKQFLEYCLAGTK